jgi:hypothetical protein
MDPLCPYPVGVGAENWGILCEGLRDVMKAENL